MSLFIFICINSKKEDASQLVYDISYFVWESSALDCALRKPNAWNSNAKPKKQKQPQNHVGHVSQYALFWKSHLTSLKLGITNLPAAFNSVIQKF